MASPQPWNRGLRYNSYVLAERPRLPSSSLVTVTVATSIFPILAPLQWFPSGLPRQTWNCSSGSKAESSLIETLQFFTCSQESGRKQQTVTNH